MFWRRLTIVLLFVIAVCARADFKAGGDAYKKGDYKTAAAEFQAVAEKGDHRAMYALGSMYTAGNGVPQDYTMAMKWFLAAARYGRPDAEFKVGLLYLQGLGVKQNARRAINWFGKSAQQGYVDAQYYVGKMYAEGNGVTKDNVGACAWLNLAAMQGHPDARTLLATLSNNMTPEQLKEAGRLSDSYRAQFSKRLQ